MFLRLHLLLHLLLRLLLRLLSHLLLHLLLRLLLQGHVRSVLALFILLSCPVLQPPVNIQPAEALKLCSRDCVCPRLLELGTI